ncbi:MAG: porin family protein [Fluviicola sp.]
MNCLKTLLIVLTFGSFSSFWAQNSMFDLGLEAGLNRAQFLTDYDNGTNNVYSSKFSGAISPSVGVNFQVNTKRFFSFKTGISFDRKVYIMKSTGNQIGSTYKRRDVNTFDYVSLPLLGKLTFGKKVQFFMNVGVYFAHLVDQKILTEASSSDISEGQIYYSDVSFNESTIDRYKRHDFGLIGGLGIGIPIKKHWYISLEAREVIGFTTLDNSTKYSAPPTKNANFSMLLGVAYKLGFYKEK